MKKTTPDELLGRIREALQELRLPEMATQLEQELLHASPAGEGRLDFVWRLLEPQLLARRHRSVAWRVRRALLPGPKTFDEFDFAFQPKLDRDRVLELATLDFIRRGENLLVAGMSGTGKSHICIAIGQLACVAGIRTRYTTSADMLSALAASLAAGTLTQTLRAYTHPELLIIDEVGLDRPERETTPDAQLFYRVIRPRYQGTRSTVITSNIEWDKWGSYLGDDVATVAILDRLIEHGHLLRIDGPSWRGHQHEMLNARSTGKSPPPDPKATKTPGPEKRSTKKATKPRR
jgi:DNA replication protein DnaC